MRNDSSTVPAKFTVGGLAICELLNVRCQLADSADDTRDLDESIFFSNISGSVSRGLPQFKDIGKDPESDRADAIYGLQMLSKDLIAAGLMTPDRIESINMAFESLTGHDALVEQIDRLIVRRAAQGASCILG